MKIRPVGELFHAGGRMDRQTEIRADLTKQTVTYRNFANAQKLAKFMAITKRVAILMLLMVYRICLSQLGTVNFNFGVDVLK